MSNAAPLAGAIFTTTPNGAIVNENVHYNQKIEVYLDGGPGPNAPQRAAGLPDGDYVFQVTDPSGAVLLSQDPSRCRVFRVQNGIIVALRDKTGGGFVDHTLSDGCHVNDSPEGAAGATGKHDTNIDADHGGQGAIVVQLMPFFDTPNPGGVYKAWVMPEDRYLANTGSLDAAPTPKCTRHGSPSNCTGNAVQIGFVRDDGFGPPRDQVKTDNFKVQEFVRPVLHVHKFNDLNRDGTWQRGTEPEIGVDQCVDVTALIVDCTVGGGWTVFITEPLPSGPVTNSYFTPVGIIAEPPGVWIVQEETFASAGWQQTAVFVDGVPQGITNPVNVTVLGNSGETHEVIFGNAQKPETPRVNTEIHLGSGSGEGANPTVVTGSVPLGSTVHDKATVKPTTKNGTPTGSVTFTFYTGGDCTTGTPAGNTDTVSPLVGGVAHPSKDRGPLAAGSYAFKAHFTSGDPARWTDADSACEPFKVNRAKLSLSTELHLGPASGEGSPPTVVLAPVPLGSTVHDQAKVTGIVAGFAPAHPVTFTFYTGGDCATGTPQPAGSAPIVGTAPGVAHPSNDEGPLGSGSYAFRASLAGDSNYDVSNSGAAACEPLTVGPPGNPAIVKSPRLANLWLCQPVASCATPTAGVGEVDFNLNLNGPVRGLDPKCLATAPDPTTCPRQSIGSFQFEVRYDSKLISVQVEPGSLWRDAGGNLFSDVTCATLPTQNGTQFRCNIKGKTLVLDGPGTLAVVKVTATADIYSMLIPNQDNGIVTQLINQDCSLSDLQSHPIKLAGQTLPGVGTAVCDDADVTIRYLEGDVNADCEVNVQDQQLIAFRWGAHSGSLLYNSRYDLEPAVKGDGDIDAKDLQVVWGRHNTITPDTCANPHPGQDPVDPKAIPTKQPTPTPPPF